MRLCRFQTEQGPQWGQVESRDGVEWITALAAAPPEDRVAAFSGEFTPVRAGHAQLLAPVVPSKIICVGRNYSDHAKELGNVVPAEPLLFFKPSSSLLAPGGTILSPSVSQRVDFEGELGVVIGKVARDLADDADVGGYIRGYVCVNDVTARDLQKKDDQWARAKGFDTFCPVGPWMADAASLDPASVSVTTRLNGEVKQQGNTRDMFFGVPFLVRYISRIFTLLPGDLIATGTPAGVGPMLPGDTVEVEIDGLGVLRNVVERRPAVGEGSARIQ
jgi:2-keto-4-pentenoate hydratase/2-oxohepta-3-ene-1,7-dioic acid hydratase in catechol pathway